MKTIGLIGGLTWQSSKFYYDFLKYPNSRQIGWVTLGENFNEFG